MTVVDVNDELLRDLQDRIDIRTVVGSGAYPSILEAAGARDADIFIALTNSDEVNMVACQIVWSLFNKDATRIARVRSADYARHSKLFSTEDRTFAVDVPISPEQLVTEHVFRLIKYPGALQVLDFAEERVRLVGVKALRSGALVGQQLKQLPTHIKGRDARVAAIYRNGQSVKPTGDTVIEHGDEVFFIETDGLRRNLPDRQRSILGFAGRARKTPIERRLAGFRARKLPSLKFRLSRRFPRPVPHGDYSGTAGAGIRSRHPRHSTERKISHQATQW